MPDVSTIFQPQKTSNALRGGGWSVICAVILLAFCGVGYIWDLLGGESDAVSIITLFIFLSVISPISSVLVLFHRNFLVYYDQNSLLLYVPLTLVFWFAVGYVIAFFANNKRSFFSLLLLSFIVINIVYGLVILFGGPTYPIAG